MANISNIENIQNLDSWDVGVTIHRTQAFPLDNSSYFTSLEAAQDFATNGATSYIGQQLFVITNNVDECFVDTYVIQNSDGVLEKIATKTVTDKLAADIKDIQDDVRGGVNYKGHINLDEKLHDSSLPKYPVGMTLAQIFGSYLNIVDASAHFIENLSLNNGWLYNVTTSAEYVTEDGISLENNDYIIIHSRSLSCVDVSALVRDNIDIIEAVQDDYVRLYQHSQLSDSLSIEIDTLSANLSSDIKSLSIRLSTTIDEEFLLSEEAIDILRGTLINEFDTLSGKLSNDIENLSISLSTEVSNLSSGISSDVIALSGALSTEIHTLSGSLSADIDSISSSLSSTTNSSYIHISGDSGIGTLQLTSDLSVAKSLTIGADNTPNKLQINNNGTVKFTIYNESADRQTFDVDLRAKSGTLALTSEVDALSTSLSGDINSLSARLSSEVIALSNSLSGTIGLSVDNLYRQVLSNDEDISYLSIQLSTVADDHYYRTLSSIESKGHVDPYPDNLLLTDHSQETNHKNYYLMFKYGTLVLSSIN